MRFRGLTIFEWAWFIAAVFIGVQLLKVTPWYVAIGVSALLEWHPMNKLFDWFEEEARQDEARKKAKEERDGE